MTQAHVTGGIVDELPDERESLVERMTDLAHEIYRAIRALEPRLQFVPGPRQPIAAPLFRLEKLAADWNAAYPIGTKVVVQMEDGRHKTHTTSQAWIANSHGVAIYLKGSRGYHNLDHVRPLEDANG